MNPTTARRRMPLRGALRSYWPWLTGLVVASALVFLLPDTAAHWNFLVAIFLAAAFLAACPCLFLDAPYTFWVFASALWLSLGLVIPIVKAVIVALVT
jgi:hypothetical protein